MGIRVRNITGCASRNWVCESEHTTQSEHTTGCAIQNSVGFRVGLGVGERLAHLVRAEDECCVWPQRLIPTALPQRDPPISPLF